MFIKKIKLKNFRNFQDSEFFFDNSTILLEGKNGAGKSNLLESIYFLCTGKSQRKAKKKEMIHFDKTFFLSKVNLFTMI